MALIILQKSTFPDMRDPAPKTWFGRAACTKPLRAQSNLYTAGGGTPQEAEFPMWEAPPPFYRASFYSTIMIPQKMSDFL